MVSIDQPDGYNRYLPGHTVELDASFAKPWFLGTTLSVASGTYGEYTINFNDFDHIYYIDSINASPIAYKELWCAVFAQNVLYTTAAGMGCVDISMRNNPSILFLAGDTCVIRVGNNDTVTRTFYLNIAGTKIMRSVTFGHAPGAYFTIDDFTISVGGHIHCTDGSSYNPTSYEWDFGDGSAKVTTQNPQHTYSKAGSYYPRLKVRNAYGFDTYCWSTPVVVS